MSGEARCWYLNQKGKATGPYLLAELSAFAAQGKLKGHDLVFRDGASEWKRGYDWPELVSFFSEENRSSLSRLIRLPEEERAIEDQWVLLVREDGEREVRFRQRGPFPADEIRRMLLEEKIKPSDHIWKKGAARWVPLYDVPEFQAQNLKMTTAAAQTLESVALMPEIPQIENPIEYQSEAQAEIQPEIPTAPEIAVSDMISEEISEEIQEEQSHSKEVVFSPAPSVQDMPLAEKTPEPPVEVLPEVGREVLPEVLPEDLPKVLQAVESADLIPALEASVLKDSVPEESGLLSYDEFIKKEGPVVTEGEGPRPLILQSSVEPDPIESRPELEKSMSIRPPEAGSVDVSPPESLEVREVSGSVAIERMPLYQVSPQTGHATPVLNHLPTDGSADEEIPAERLRDDFEFAPIHRINAIPDAPQNELVAPAMVSAHSHEESFSESVVAPVVVSAEENVKIEKPVAARAEKSAGAKQKLAPVDAPYDFKPPQTFFSKMAPAFMVLLVALFGVGIWATIRTDKSAFQGRENSAMAPQPQFGNPMAAPVPAASNEAQDASVELPEEASEVIPSANHAVANPPPVAANVGAAPAPGPASVTANSNGNPAVNAATNAAGGSVGLGVATSGTPAARPSEAEAIGPATAPVAGGPNAGIINAVNGAKPTPEVKPVANTVAPTPAPAPVNPAVDFDGRNPIVRVSQGNFIEIMGPFRKGELLRIRMEGRAGQILEVPALVQKYEVRVAQDHYYRISIPESKIPRGDYSVNVQFGMNRFAKNLAVGKDAQFASQLQNYRKTISFEQQQERKRLLKAARDLASILAKSDSSKDLGVLKTMQKDLEKKIPKEVKMVRQSRYELIFFEYWEKIAVQWERVQATLKDSGARNPASTTEISRARKAANSLEAEIRSASIWSER